jgi:hypothetical protein
MSKGNNDGVELIRKGVWWLKSSLDKRCAFDKATNANCAQAPSSQRGKTVTKFLL